MHHSAYPHRACAIEAQEVPVLQLTPGSARKPDPTSINPAQPAPLQTVALTVAKGSPLQDQEVRVKKVGQPVHARIVEPVYAFYHIVVPVGSEISGEVTKIETLSGGKRTLAALNADFTPLRSVEVGFHELVLPTGDASSCIPASLPAQAKSSSWSLRRTKKKRKMP